MTTEMSTAIVSGPLIRIMLIAPADDVAGVQMVACIEAFIPYKDSS